MGNQIYFKIAGYVDLDCKNVQHVKIYKKVPQLKMFDNGVKSYSS
jgi:hypothetical protein